MIKIVKNESLDFWGGKCNSCGSGKNFKDIQIGINNIYSSVRLCDKCLRELKERINEI